MLALCFLIFFISVLGISLFYDNYILILLSLELLFISFALFFIFCALLFDDFSGLLFALFLLTISACESAIGLTFILLI